MELLKNIFIDSLNGFSMKSVPLFFFQLISAALLAFCFEWLLNKKMKEKVSHRGTLLAAAVAVLSSIVKYSLPYSVLGAAAIILLLRKEETRNKQLAQFAMISIGIGCGIGSVIQTTLGFFILGVLLVLIPFQKD